MNRINTFFIKLFGGYTQEELDNHYNQDWTNGRKAGFLSGLRSVKNYADSINGTPAEDWCKLVYSYICSNLE